MSIKDRFSDNILLIKLLVTGFLILLFLIPMSMVKDVILERADYKREAETSIAESWAEQQTLWGPVLVVPYTRTSMISTYDAALGKMVERKQDEKLNTLILPADLKMDIKVDTEVRYRGIYSVPVYTAHVNFKGNFADIQAMLPKREADMTFPDAPYLAFGLNDIRGIGADLNIVWDKHNLRSAAGSNLSFLPNGFHARLNTDSATLNQGAYNVTLTVKGVQALNVVPVGQKTNLHMASAWPHPRFDGKFLPSKRSITEKGFSADWETGLLATNMENLLGNCLNNKECAVTNTNFGVSFFQPVDVYQQTLRAAKYAILLIMLTFVAFFMFEAIQRLRIHPIQYMLVGAALALFYLVLLSLSEHIGFDVSYGVSAVVTLALLWFYVGAILKSRKAALVFTGMMTILYAMIYIILMSRDYALMLGTALVFIVLVVIMALTRHINWYALNDKESV